MNDDTRRTSRSLSRTARTGALALPRTGATLALSGPGRGAHAGRGRAVRVVAGPRAGPDLASLELGRREHHGMRFERRLEKLLEMVVAAKRVRHADPAGRDRSDREDDEGQGHRGRSIMEVVSVSVVRSR